MAITVVGLGPGDGRLLTRQAWEVLSGAGRVYLRTARHPAVADLPVTVEQVSFDHLYESAGDFAAVYGQIVEELLQLEKGTHGNLPSQGRGPELGGTQEDKETGGQGDKEKEGGTRGNLPSQGGGPELGGTQEDKETAARPGGLRQGRGDKESIVYAVPGHPLVGESTVTRLLEAAGAAGVEVRIVAGLSFVEPTLTALGVDGLEGLQLFDAIEVAGYHFPPVNPELPLLLAQVYSRLVASDLKLSLMALYPDEHDVFLVHGAGTAEEVVEAVPLYGIDRSERVGHLTSLYVPPLPYAASLTTLAETVAILRAPGGCPWDQEQTPQSMRAGFLEEAAEVLAALDGDDPEAVAEELGDVLYHLVMQAQMAAENGDFRLVEVIAGIDEKLKRRHPHVWGDWQVADSAEVVRNWEMIKEGEKGTHGNSGELRGTQEGQGDSDKVGETAVRPGGQGAASLLDNIPVGLPALARAQKIQGRVKKVGFDWPDIGGVVAKVREEIDELVAADSVAERAMEMGDVFFALVNLARWLDIDAETVLREANLRFSGRFRRLEELAAGRGQVLAELDVEALEGLWQEVKRVSSEQ